MLKARREKTLRDAVEERGFSARDFLRILFRHKWKGLFTFIVVTAGVTTLTLMSTAIYQSDAKILVNPGRLTVDPSVVGPTPGVSQDVSAAMRVEQDIIQSRTLAEKVVDTFGVERLFAAEDTADGAAPAEPSQTATSAAGPGQQGLLVRLGLRNALAPRERAIVSIINDLIVRTDRGVMSVSLNAPSAKLAHDVLDTLITLYLERHIEVNVIEGNTEFFEKEAEEGRLKLEQKEDELEAFRSLNRLSAPESQSQQLVAQIYQLKSAISEAKMTVSASEARSALLERLLKDRPKSIELTRLSGVPNDAVQSLKSDLVQLRLQEAQAITLYPEDSREVKQLRDQVAFAEDLLAGEQESYTQSTMGIDASYQEFEMTLETERVEAAAQRARLAEMEGELKAVQDELAVLSTHQLTLTRLQRECNSNRPTCATGTTSSARVSGPPWIARSSPTSVSSRRRPIR